MVKLTPSTIITGAATTLAVGTLGYIAYFDCQSGLSCLVLGGGFLCWWWSGWFESGAAITSTFIHFYPPLTPSSRPPSNSTLTHTLLHRFSLADQRRNNLEFRRTLLKERKKAEKVQSLQANRERANQGEALKNAVRAMRDERTPQSVEEREAYFLEQVAMGEALAAQGGLEAICFADFG